MFLELVGLTMSNSRSYYGHMKKASVSELKNQISRYLDYVKHGETVIVLDRNTPVAELKPITERSPTSRLIALERKGIIRRGTSKIPARFFTAKLGGEDARVLEALLNERDHGR
ncbi:MAG TPA: type II toxin-antitoxin system prevent-host-death family antitoxin [Candidatus Binatia bacterium]